MQSSPDVCIIGAGPYGLSLASYMNSARISFRIFGKPFWAWRTQMPLNMILKSSGFASNVADPRRELTLKRFCGERGIPYADDHEPIHLEDFCRYGMEFQRRLVPQLEDIEVNALSRCGKGFRLELKNGEEVFAQKVIVATGTSFFEYVPRELDRLGRDLVTHSSAHRDFERFRGKDLAVLGAGASGVNAAAFANRVGANVQLFVREPVRYDQPPSGEKPTWYKDLLRPRGDLGRGWPRALMSWAPWAFHRLPADLRLYINENKLGPAAGWPLRGMVEGRIPLHVGSHLQSVTEYNGRVRLSFRGAHGESREVIADHVIAGTGFRVNLARIPFLDRELTQEINTLKGSPRLNPQFESSIAGLYFTGLAGAASFGPLVRFVAGTRFTSATICNHLKERLSGRRSWSGLRTASAEVTN